MTDSEDPLVPLASVPDDYRNHLVGALQAAQHDYDQAILTLTAGTLALSATFAHDIAPTPAGDSGALLGAAWILLVYSMIAIVLSFVTSQRDLRNLIDALDRREQNVGANMKRLDARLTRAMNISAGSGLILGLAAFAAYAFVNLKGG